MPKESSKKSRFKQTKSLLRSRLLRGPRLVDAAKAELARMTNLSPKTDPINISALAKRLKVTRQALYNNNLKKIIAEHTELQRKNFSQNLEAAILRRPLEERIVALEQENKALRKQIDGWIERWAAIEYNAKMHGVNPDLIFAPMPPPQRKMRLLPKRNNER